jgi:hypothetical protein
MQEVDRFLFIVAMGDAGLVGDDERVVTVIVGPPDRLARPVELLELLVAMHVSGVFVQHAVAVEEDRGPADDSGHHLLRAGELVGQADINERAFAYAPLQPPLRGESRQDVLLERDEPFTDRAQP